MFHLKVAYWKFDCLKYEKIQPGINQFPFDLWSSWTFFPGIFYISHLWAIFSQTERVKNIMFSVNDKYLRRQKIRDRYWNRNQQNVITFRLYNYSFKILSKFLFQKSDFKSSIYSIFFPERIWRIIFPPRHIFWIALQL